MTTVNTEKLLKICDLLESIIIDKTKYVNFLDNNDNNIVSCITKNFVKINIDELTMLLKDLKSAIE